MINKRTRTLNVVIFRWYELTTHKDNNAEASAILAMIFVCMK